MALSACLSDLCDVLRQTGFTAREMFGGFDRYVRVLFDSTPLIKPGMCATAMQCFDNAGIDYVIVLYCIVLYCIVLYCIVLYCIVLYCTVLHCIALYCIVLYCIVLYCSVVQCIVV